MRSLNERVGGSLSNGRKKVVLAAVVLASAAVLSGCGSTQKLDPQNQSGFLGSGEYAQLQPIESPDDGVKIYRYINPKANLSQYNKVIVEPIVLYQTAEADAQGEKGISEQTIFQVRQALTDKLRESLRNRDRLATAPGPGVATLTIAITGAQALGDGFRPTDLIPVRAVLGLASKATGLNSKNPVLVIEAKGNDSRTGELLGEALYVVSGESFRMQVDSVQAFQSLAEKWVQTALRVAAGRQP
jgi:hypothetical protein